MSALYFLICKKKNGKKETTSEAIETKLIDEKLHRYTMNSSISLNSYQWQDIVDLYRFYIVLLINHPVLT
jgi:hypothetical protein